MLAEPLTSHDVPYSPWQNIRVNFIDWVDEKYLILVDNFSKYPFMFQMHSTTILVLIGHLKELFSLEGTPEKSSLTMVDHLTPKNATLHKTSTMMSQTVLKAAML